MDPATAGLIAGGLSVGSTILGNQQSQRNAENQMSFQREMSNTAHQREVADLKAAGLNPILSALGSGASTPGGAMGSVNDLGSGISTGASTALAIREQNKNLDFKDAQIDNLREQDIKTSTETMLNRHSARSMQEDLKTKMLQNELLQKTLPSMIKEAKAKGDWSQVNQIMGVIKSGTSSAADLYPTIKLKGK